MNGAVGLGSAFHSTINMTELLNVQTCLMKLNVAQALCVNYRCRCDGAYQCPDKSDENDCGEYVIAAIF